MGAALQVPGTEALTRRLGLIPAELSGALFWVAAGPIADPAEAGLTWRGLLLCALDGFQVRVPDTEANREYFGSSGTADNSSPFPQVRAIIVTAARTKGTLGVEFGPSSDGEQTLTRRLVKARPHLFGKGRLILMDRNFPGFALIKAIRAQGAHLLMRIKSLEAGHRAADGSVAAFGEVGLHGARSRAARVDGGAPCPRHSPASPRPTPRNAAAGSPVPISSSQPPRPGLSGLCWPACR